MLLKLTPMGSAFPPFDFSQLQVKISEACEQNTGILH